MKYTFKDGSEVDLERIENISPVRDLGKDSKTISMSKIGFSVHLSKRESLRITRTYHFQDWAAVKLELEEERQDLLKEWKNISKKP